LCIHAPTCGYGPAIEHNGDVYSCDHYVEPGYRLGNIAENPHAGLLFLDFFRDKVGLHVNGAARILSTASRALLCFTGTA
jgi:sulfatase maturation enzyme AslB (radical SAM superfamily)